MKIHSVLDNFFSNLHEGKKLSYLTDPKIAVKAPYSVGVYRQLLVNIKKEPKFFLTAFGNRETTGKHACLFNRHDIDTSECIRKMGILLDIDSILEIPTAIFFRADDEEYRLSDYKNQINQYKEKGFEIGLHTLCYTQDNYLREFEREIKHFKESLGITPECFTVHGLGTFRIDIRTEFCKIISDKLGEYDLLFTDCSEKLRRYDYVFEDCHRSEENGCRVLYEDFFNLPPFIKKGKNYLILTHPVYWE